jgi:hypothetical protein
MTRECDIGKINPAVIFKKKPFFSFFTGSSLLKQARPLNS